MGHTHWERSDVFVQSFQGIVSPSVCVLASRKGVWIGMFEVTLKGILVSLTLIVAIGGQNVFVLRKGIAKSHIFAVCLTCFICDFFLMGMGIMGVGAWINESTRLTIF